MRVVGNPRHAVHCPEFEYFRGRRVPCFEMPARAEFVRESLEQAGYMIESPDSFPDTKLLTVHSQRYLDFLRGAWKEWEATGNEGDAFPCIFPVRDMRTDINPKNFAARLGMFSFDTGSPFCAGTWDAARTGADCALTAAGWIAQGEKSAFVLTRPPGHHAGRECFGGYCFLNNAAIAAQSLRDQGVSKVAILDVDFHHGNGTQDIFYGRGDVLYVSIHGDPMTEYPFFLGHADEIGSGAGVGANLNLPLAAGTSTVDWFAALERALQRIREFDAEALVISLGLDAAEVDPISKFKLKESDFRMLGRYLRKTGLPTLFVLEGGYAVAAIGENACAVVNGFEVD